MSDAQAGTPGSNQDGTLTSGTPVESKDGSGNDAQKWQEALKWKQKAEDFNRLESELALKNQQIEELARLAYSGGVQAATDPNAELVKQLEEQANYDPVAKATLINMQQTAMVQAEAWLMNQLMYVPQNKRDKVANIVRTAGYQMNINDALNLVTDPETKTLAQQLAEMKSENERLRSAKTNGVSPSAAVPSSSNADDGRTKQTIPFTEYAAILKQGGPKAAELMQAVGNGSTKLVRE